MGLNRNDLWGYTKNMECNEISVWSGSTKSEG